MNEHSSKARFHLVEHAIVRQPETWVPEPCPLPLSSAVTSPRFDRWWSNCGFGFFITFLPSRPSSFPNLAASILRGIAACIPLALLYLYQLCGTRLPGSLNSKTF